MSIPAWACEYLADALLLLHFAIVAFLVGGLLVIWLGGLLRWPIVRHRRLRLLHLGAMGFVLWEAMTGRDCPLTVWENDLRVLAGEAGRTSGSFVQSWLHRLLFYEASETTFSVIYALFFAAIGASWWIVRPHPGGRTDASAGRRDAGNAP